MTVLLGTPWSLIKQIEAPYLFDWENAIALHTMHWNWASSHGEVEISRVFCGCGRNLRYIPELQRRCTFETRVCAAESAHLSRYDGLLRNIN